MKNTGTKRLLSLILALLMAVPGFTGLSASAATDSGNSTLPSGNAPVLSDALDADAYKTYLSTTIASLRFGEDTRDALLKAAYGDDKDEDGVTRFNEIWTSLVKKGTVDASIDVDSELSVLNLDESTKTKVVAELTDDDVVRYMKGANDYENIVDIMQYVTSDSDVARPAVESDFESKEDYREGSVYLSDMGNITWTFDVPESGFYNISFDYYAVKSSVSTIQRMMYIDGEILFSESRNLSFSKNWSYQYVDLDENGIPDYREGKHSFRQDKNENDLRPDIVQTPEWRTYYCSDTEGYYTGYFSIYFSAGEHQITLSGLREEVVIGGISLLSPKTFKSYAEYIADYEKMSEATSGEKHPLGSSVVKIEAETPDYVSDTSVYMANDRTSPINSPTNPSSQYYNVLGREGFSSMGQWAAYEFTVEDDGFYSFAMRYHQNTLEGMFVSRAIKLWSSDGAYGEANGTATLPFEEASLLRFDYSDDWQSRYIGDGETTFEFYFKKGVTYRVVFEVSLGQLADVIQRVQNSLEVINECYLNILKLTGATPDEYRDYKFNQIMPGTVRNLLLQSYALDDVSKELRKLCGSGGSHTATLDSVALLLYRMGSKESEIAANLSTLKSYIGTLGTWINTSKAQTLPTDLIQVQNIEAKKPRANANFWESFSYEVVAFFSSFVVDYNSMGIVEGTESKTSIDVWLATGRDQSLIWRNMVDNKFTPQTQIAVNLKLVAGGTILPSVLAKQGPDIYLGLGAADAVNYAIRSAVLPVESYDTFDETLGYDNYDPKTDTYYMNGEVIPKSDINYNYATMVPLSLYGRTYGLPETTYFPMLFYRKDIFAEEGLELPETWDDMLSISSSFQANNMEIGLAYGTAVNIFIYQNGGSLWRYEDDEFYDAKYAGAHIGLDTDEALDAFKKLARLYTDYSFPVSFDPANRFRTGEMPMIVSDYSTCYNQLIVFASEIAGLWEFAPLPGTRRVNENGETILDRRSVATVTAVTMMNGCRDDEAAWTFMAWQGGADIQSQYGNEMVALVGPAAKYATANIQALDLLSWSTSEANALRTQFEQLAAVPNYPGSYIIGRYIGFAMMDAINEDIEPTEALRNYITAINKELIRKRKEFDGKVFHYPDGKVTFDVPPLEIGEKPPLKDASN